MKRIWLGLIVAAALPLLSCEQNDDPAGAKALYAQVKSGAGYRAWRRAPGFPSRTPSFTEHGDAVEIFVDPTIAAVLDGPSAISAWPKGATIVMESYTANTLSELAMMNKGADGTWFWAEYQADGTPTSSGKPEACIDCHKHRQLFSDWVYAFEFPK